MITRAVEGRGKLAVFTESVQTAKNIHLNRHELNEALYNISFGYINSSTSFHLETGFDSPILLGHDRSFFIFMTYGSNVELMPH